MRVTKHQTGSPRLISDTVELHYSTDITVGALMLPESRIIADLLLRNFSNDAFRSAVQTDNVLKLRSKVRAARVAHLIRARLQTMQPPLWTMIRDGSGTLATHAALAAAVKHSRLLADFLRLVVADQYRIFGKSLSNKLWNDYIDGCRERDITLPEWKESTRVRLRSSVFQILAQSGYIESSRSLKLQSVHIADDVLRYLNSHHDDFVVRCIEVGP